MKTRVLCVWLVMFLMCQSGKILFIGLWDGSLQNGSRCVCSSFESQILSCRQRTYWQATPFYCVSRAYSIFFVDWFSGKWRNLRRKMNQHEHFEAYENQQNSYTFGVQWSFPNVADKQSCLDKGKCCRKMIYCGSFKSIRASYSPTCFLHLCMFP